MRVSFPNFTPAMPGNNRWPSSSPDQTDPMRANFISTSGAKLSALTRSNTANERIITKRDVRFGTRWI